MKHSKQDYYYDDPDYTQNYDVDQPKRRAPQNYDVSEERYSQRVQQYPPQRQYPQYPPEQEESGYEQGYRQGYEQGYQQAYYRDNRNYGDSYDDNSRNQRRYDRGYDDGYDDRRGYTKRAPKKKTSGAIITVRVIAILLLIAGLGIVGFKLYQYYDDKKGHSELQALSADFNQLYSRNNDFYGWLKVDDTEIDYPVMYTPSDPEHYLHTDFDGNYSESGELFMDANCDPNGYHALIYGHHMFNGTMFGNLPKYGEEDYYQAHRTFRFDTMNERGEYEIFAVFYSQVYDDNEDVFKYYYYANLNDEATYNSYVANVKALSIYETGVSPMYGEKIVTLSTCNYHTNDGRFVVCGRKIN